MGFIKDLFRPVLSDSTILKYNKKGLLIEGKLKKEQIQPNSIDLTLANTWAKMIPNSTNDNGKIIDPRYKVKYKKFTFKKEVDEDEIEREYFILRPKEFVLMASNEVLNIPNGVIAFVQGRSSIARLAIQTEQAGLIDSGFNGTITFEVFNQSDHAIKLYKDMRIAQVYFFKSQYAKEIYGSDKGSKYFGQIEATGSRINEDFEE